MTGHEERRKIARELRAAAVYLPNDIDSEDLEMAIATTVCNYDVPNVETLFNRLADLIEPSCDRDTPQKVAEEMFGKMRHSTKEEADAYDTMLKSMSVEIRPVDRDALLALADKMSRYASLRKSHGMDVDTMAVMAWVHRIRAACGEVKPCDERS